MSDTDLRNRIFKKPPWLLRPTNSDSEIFEDYRRTGYLGEAVGTVKDVFPVTERRCFLRFSWRSFLGGFVAGAIAIGSSLWVLVHYGLGSACLAFLVLGPLWMFIHSACGVDGFFVAVDDIERGQCIEISSYGPWSDVLLFERVVVVNSEGESQEFERVPESRYSYKPISRGEKVSRYEGQVLYLEEAKMAASRIYSRLRSEQDRASARAQAEATRRQAEAADRDRELENLRAGFSELLRLSHCRLDNWSPENAEPFIRHLPSPWVPFATVGLAYANVVAYGSPPPAQRFDPHHGRWETVGPQTVATRGIYLVGTNLHRTFNQQALVVGPQTLPGTTSQDLVMFVLDHDGAVKFLGNPARWEIYDATQTDEEKKKLAMLKPVLTKLYERVLSAGPGSSGWT